MQSIYIYIHVHSYKPSVRRLILCSFSRDQTTYIQLASSTSATTRNRCPHVVVKQQSTRFFKIFKTFKKCKNKTTLGERKFVLSIPFVWKLFSFKNTKIKSVMRNTFVFSTMSHITLPKVETTQGVVKVLSFLSDGSYECESKELFWLNTSRQGTRLEQTLNWQKKKILSVSCKNKLVYEHTSCGWKSFETTYSSIVILMI